MLEIIGLREMIAENDEDYTAIALRLGRDRAWRNDVSHRIAAACDRLFDDRTPVAKLASVTQNRQPPVDRPAFFETNLGGRDLYGLESILGG